MPCKCHKFALILSNFSPARLSVQLVLLILVFLYTLQCILQPNHIADHFICHIYSLMNYCIQTATSFFHSHTRPGRSIILLVQPSAHAQRSVYIYAPLAHTRSAKIKHLGDDVINRSPTHITVCTWSLALPTYKIAERISLWSSGQCTVSRFWNVISFPRVMFRNIICQGSTTPSVHRASNSCACAVLVSQTIGLAMARPTGLTLPALHT